MARLHGYLVDVDGVSGHDARDVYLVADVALDGILIFDLEDLVADDEDGFVAHLHALFSACDVVFGASYVLDGAHGVGDGSLPILGERGGGGDGEEDGGGS